jgi:C-terminal processing protease CtpA/Prc
VPFSSRFPGRVSVLIGPYVASGTTMMLAVLREHAELRLVGEPTAGSAEGPTAGLLFFLTLPKSRIRVNLPVFSQRTSATRFEPGLGVAPDVLVRETIADLLAGRDAALEAAWR